MISSNNKEIKVNENYYQALVLEYKTGLTPSDPWFEYGYFPGNANAPAAKRMVGFSQSFDFPTTYQQKRKYIQKQIDAAGHKMNKLRQDILLEAKYKLIDMIFLTKLDEQYKYRKNLAETLFTSYERKFDIGESTVLDYNKAKTELLKARNDMFLNDSDKNQTMEKLSQLNGGLDLQFLAISYPAETLDDLNLIINESLNSDPGYMVVSNEKDAANRNIKLQKSMALPKLELGYGSETVVNESFRGGMIGLSFPLWERKNTVKRAKSFAEYTYKKLDSYSTLLTSEISLGFLNAKALKESYENYQKLVNELKSEELLGKALDLGHISLIEYILEIKYYYDTVDTLLKLERDYFKALAVLYKYKL
jgi:outer membrane protein TolC